MVAELTEEKSIKFSKGKNEKVITLKELRDEISQCLQIKNLNFLIGAGCSSFCDDTGNEKAIPTMAKLTEQFYIENSDFEADDENKAKDKFPNNLEALMNHLISFRNILPESRQAKVSERIQRINRFIFDKVCDGLKCSELKNLYKEFYLRIVKKTRQVPINVFTTNYDIYNESALDELRFMYNNGFLGSAQRIFNPNSYNYIVVENLNLSRDIWKSVSNFINLHKIHGSINWIKENDPSTDTPHILEKDIVLVKSQNQFDSLMIYPTPQKDRSTLMIPYSDLFRIMQNNLLKENSLLIVMGYSFSDEHINRIILNALSVYDFRIVIFGDSEMIQRLREIGDNRIWIINSADKIHFFKNIVEKVLPTLDDELKEELEIRRSIHKLAAVLGEGNNNE